MPGCPEDAAAMIRCFVQEDLGPGDITSETLLGPDVPGVASIVARQPTFVVGLEHAVEVFRAVGATGTPLVEDGWVPAGEALLRVAGPARSVLAGERTALNLLARMCGVATCTRQAIERLRAAGLPTLVAATRKTTPGIRLFEKQAVARAGGDPYRQGLWDVAMVKDNHLAAHGDLGDAVKTLCRAHPGTTVVAEAETLEDVLAAARGGAHWVMIDNRPPETGAAWAEAARAVRPTVRIEASGGIRPEDVVAYGWADRISMGWLTQGAPVPDLGLDWEGSIHE